MKKILITGGCGFIGSNLIPIMLRSGYNVKVLDNCSSIDNQYISSFDIEFIKGDIRDKVAISNALSDVVGVIHLAASGSVVDSVKSPEDNFDNNVLGTFNLLNECKKVGIKNITFASTGGALIGNAKPPVSEKSLPLPISPYGSSKLCCEAYCSSFSHSYDMNIKALRFANVIGQNSFHKKGAVTSFIKSLLNNEPINIFGDGTATRDFLFVDDLCKGILNAHEKNIVGFNCIHLASGKETSVNQLAKTLIDISGKSNHPKIYLDSRKGEVEKNFASYDLAKKLIHFQPETSVYEALFKTWEWFNENHMT